MALTRITEGVIKPNENYVVNNINSSGVTTSTNFKTGTSNLHNVGIEIAGINVLGADTPIGTGATIYDAGGAVFTGVVTATSFSGSGNIGGIDGNFSGNVTAVDATFTGNVSIGGTLTYEDVTNIDSVGLITARNGIDCNGTLEVSSTSNFDGTVKVADKIEHLGDDNTNIRFPAPDKITLETSGKERFQVDSNGNVYVGGVGASATAGSLWLNDTSANASKIWQDNGNSALVFGTGSGQGERLRIDSVGRLLIGTTSAGTSAQMLTLYRASTSALELRTNTTGNSTIHFTDGDPPSGNAAYRGYIEYRHSDDDMRFATSASERLRIDSSGYVGIGTDDPQYELHVWPRGATSSGQICAQSQGSNTFAELVLKCTDGGTGSLWRNSSGKTDYGGANSLNIYQSANANIAFFTAGNNQRLLITGTGEIQTKTRSAEVRRMILSGSPSNSAFNIEAHDGESGTSSGDVQGKLGLFYNDGSTLTNTACISFERGSGAPDGAMVFVTNQAERLRITSGGFSHIGNPTVTNAWDTHSISLPGANSATFACPATVAIFGGTGYGTANMAGGGIRFVGYYDSSNNFTTFAHVAGVKENTTNGNYAGALTFHTRQHGNLGAERLRISSTGLVGVGTVTNWSPYKLQVAGGLGIAESANTGQQAMSITNNSIQTLSIGVAYNALLLNKDGGNVGITEASPQRALHIGAGGVFRFERGDGTRYGELWNDNSFVELKASTDPIRLNAQSYIRFDIAGDEKLRISSSGGITSKGNGANFEQVETNSYNASWAAANGKIAIKGDLSGGNYFGWRQKSTASGSVSQANAEKKLPTINDFTYPNSSNGMLIASTSKIGFAAAGESPQYSSGVTMLFDHNGLILGGSRAFDCSDSVSGATTALIKLRGSQGKIELNNPAEQSGRLTIKGANSSGNTCYALTNSGKALQGIDVTCTTVGNNGFGGAISFGCGGNGRSAIAARQYGTDDDVNGLSFFAHTSNNGSDNTVESLRIHPGGALSQNFGPCQLDGLAAAALVNITGRQQGANNSHLQTDYKQGLSIGWYTIATCNSGRASGRIGIRETYSSRHQACVFYAAHHYGGGKNQNCVNVIFSSGRHSGNPIGAIRIKAYGTYDGAMLQVYLRDGAGGVQAFMLGDNMQDQGWIMKNWVADGTDPGGLGNYTNIQNNFSTPSSYSDMNEIQSGGMSSGGHIIPGTDNQWTLGRGSYRWNTVYGMSSSINTSDETLKQDIASLTTAEMNAAKRLSALFKTYRWKESVVEKGTDKARTHSGIIAQSIKTAMEAESLDPDKYSFYCIDEWYEDSEGTKLPLETVTRQGDTVGIGTNITLGGNIVVPSGFNKVTRYSVRYEELFAFIAAYNEQRFTSIESRLTALESS